MGVVVPTNQTIETTSPDGVDLRQVINIGDGTATTIAKVQSADPASTDAALTVRDVRGNATLPVRVDPTGTTVQPISGTVAVSNFPATQTVNGTVSIAAGTGVELVDAAGTNKATISAAGALKVDNSAVIQPVSGTVTAN